jgi:predicted anti-sigma-YlaC factor YlaD
MKQCSKIKNKLLFYIQDDLDKYSMQMVEGHLEKCKSCYDKYLKLKAVLHEFKPGNIMAPAFFFTNVKGRLEQNLDNSTRKIMVKVRPVLMTFILIAGMGLGMILGMGLEKNKQMAKQYLEQDYLQQYGESQYLNTVENDPLLNQYFVEHKSGSNE